MLKNLLKLFFPELCFGCETIIYSSENKICANCRHHLPLTNHLLNNENEAFKKFYGRLNIEHASSMLYYHKKGIVQKLIHNLKYKGHQEIGVLLGEWHASELKNSKILDDIDYIIPVPLHKNRLKSRGYNQVDGFCKSIGKEHKITFDASVLTRNKNAITQSKKKLSDRNALIENTFSITFSEKYHDKHFLLIDDVLTTGATLEACGKELLKIPNAKLSIITIAYSES